MKSNSAAERPPLNNPQGKTTASRIQYCFNQRGNWTQANGDKHAPNEAKDKKFRRRHNKNTKFTEARNARIAELSIFRKRNKSASIGKFLAYRFFSKNRVLDFPTCSHSEGLRFL